jgi:hypothetical protein
MRWPARKSAVLSALAALVPAVAGEQMLISNSLNTCQDDSSFSASLFNVVYTPGNNSATVDMVATSSVQGNVIFDVAISAYGYEFLRRQVDPCDTMLQGLCPMNTGKNNIDFSLPVPDDAASNIPGIAYNIPDLDAKVRIYVNLTETGESVACVEADISNGKTVDLVGVKWATAVIAGLALCSSALMSGLGHTNAASHIAANSLALFSYFQSQAIIGLTGVGLPPVVQSWTQDFQWSMGIIKTGFMQHIFTWYQRATGGEPATIFDSLTTTSVQVQKRSLDYIDEGVNLFKRGTAMLPRAVSEHVNLAPRKNIETGSGAYVVYGIQRVAFRARIETTNLFSTCLTFFCLVIVFTILAVLAFKGIVELAARQKWLSSERFYEFRHGWLTVLKGILFRICLLGFPAMCIMCLWEFTQVDSPALVVLAVFFLFGPIITLGWGASKVIRIARRSVAMHRNPAYILFSDPQALNKWGFLYIQFRASAYYFIVPLLVYTFIKALFVALAQKSGVAQAIAFIVIEAGALIGASVLRPWMDKSTNSFNIAICVVNFLNAIFLLIFTNVFGAPAIVVGAVGVVLFILNAAFSLILLLMVIISTAIIFFRKNPDARYQFMADDRASFMKSQSRLNNATTELDALAATARGDKGGYKTHFDLDEDNVSLSSDSVQRRTNQIQSEKYRGGSSPSPTNPAGPLFPGTGPEGPYHSASPSPVDRSVSSLSHNQQQDEISPAANIGHRMA